MNKITISQVAKSLIESSPGFSHTVGRLIDRHGGDSSRGFKSLEEEGGIYEVFSALAKYLEKLLESNQENEIQKIFDLVETWQKDGDERVQEAITVGLLEDLISLNPDHKLQDEPFFSFMGDETRYWAEKVKGFWRDEASISDDRSA